MATNTLNNRANGQTIDETFFNDIHQALNGDLVGRNTSGVPTANQNLGTAGIPWGTIRGNQLIIGGQAVDASSIVAPANRVVSGKTRGTAGSNLNQFITPNGAAPSFVLDGTPVNLVLVINGVTATVSTDITKSSLSVAPSTNNTALVNDVDAADQFDTRRWGEFEHRKSITIDTVGSEITALVGKWAAFKIAGTSDEYFLAYVKSATELTKCQRGYFYDSTLAPVKPAGFSNNDQITLMKLGWVFVEDDGTTVDVTYNNPTVSFQSPGSPVTGDYWKDLGNNQWNRYDGATFQVINRTLVGLVVMDTTACVAARCIDSYAKFSDANKFVLEKDTSEIIKAVDTRETGDVAGTIIDFEYDRPSWNITTDLAAATDMFDSTEQPSRAYWLYLKQNGDTVISDIYPMWRGDLQGYYHKYNIWRCVGIAFNDASSDIQGVSSLGDQDADAIYVRGLNGAGSASTKIARFDTVYENQMASVVYSDDASLGSAFECYIPGVYDFSFALPKDAATNVAGLSKNASSSEQATNLQSIATAAFMGYGVVTDNGDIIFFQASIKLKAGDIIRPHVGGGGSLSGGGDIGAGVRVTRK